MEDLKGFPSPGDPQYKLKLIDDLSIEVKVANSFEILGKLRRILKYFPGTDIAAFMENLKFRPILNIVQNVIDWVNCNMVYPALGMLTGEVRTCQDPTGKKKLIEPTDTVLPNADDFVGTGLDCSAAAAEVLTYCDLKLRDNREVRALFMAKEQRNEHEASKFGVLCNGIRNKKHYADRIEKLYDSTKKIPMYKKRYYDYKDTYSVTQQYQMLSLEEFTTTTEEQ
jgi:hypothetical protein